MVKRAMSAAAAGALLLALAAPAEASALRGIVSSNLIRNAGAEAAAGSTDGSTVAVPNWTVAPGSSFTAVQYGADGGFPAATDPGPVTRRANFFAGGPGDEQAVATQQRPIPVEFRAEIDDGIGSYTLRGFLGGSGSQEDNAVVRVDWLGGTGRVLGTATIGPVTAEQRNDHTGLVAATQHGFLPARSRKVLITLTLTRTDGTYNDGYADNLSLKVMIPTAD